MKNQKPSALTHHKRLYDYLEEAGKANLIKDIDIKIMAAQLMGGANEVAKLFIGKPDNITEELIVQCFENGMAKH
jgi:hypothetical protein